MDKIFASISFCLFIVCLHSAFHKEIGLGIASLWALLFFVTVMASYFLNWVFSKIENAYEKSEIQWKLADAKFYDHDESRTNHLETTPPETKVVSL